MWKGELERSEQICRKDEQDSDHHRKKQRALKLQTPPDAEACRLERPEDERQAPHEGHDAGAGSDETEPDTGCVVIGVFEHRRHLDGQHRQHAGHHIQDQSAQQRDRGNPDQFHHVRCPGGQFEGRCRTSRHAIRNHGEGPVLAIGDGNRRSHCHIRIRREDRQARPKQTILFSQTDIGFAKRNTHTQFGKHIRRLEWFIDAKADDQLREVFVDEGICLADAARLGPFGDALGKRTDQPSRSAVDDVAPSEAK